MSLKIFLILSLYQPVQRYKRRATHFIFFGNFHNICFKIYCSRYTSWMQMKIDCKTKQKIQLKNLSLVSLSILNHEIAILRLHRLSTLAAIGTIWVLNNLHSTKSYVNITLNKFVLIGVFIRSPKWGRGIECSATNAFTKSMGQTMFFLFFPI